MGAFFESALLFSLAVLIVLIGLLIYYFKGRITDLEQKNMKCLELIGDVYKSHLELKRGMAIPFIREQVGGMQQTPSEQVGGMQQTTDPRIKIELQEQSQEYDDEDNSDSDSDSNDDSDSDNEDNEDTEDNADNQIKMVKVDLSGSIEFSEDMEIEDVDTIGNDELLKIKQSESIIVNKIEIDGEIELDIEDDHAEQTQAVDQSKRDSYKKMSLPALRGFIISNGYQTDNAKLQNIKKNELIDLIIESM